MMQAFFSHDPRSESKVWSTMAGLAFALLTLATPLRAATPRDELLRLVPDSIGFCLVVQDLRDHAAALKDSPFLKQLSESPLGVKLGKSEDLKKLDKIQADLKAKLGLDLNQLRDDVLGDALVCVYRPGPPGKPEQEQGLFLLRARNAKVLADLIARLNKVQKEEGELKELEERQHKGVTYYRRVERNKPSYYFLRGPILGVSEQEDFLREALDCDRLRAADAVPEVTRRLRELDADRALFAVWIHPRTFDAQLEAKIAEAPADKADTIKHFATYWKALDSVVLSLCLLERDVNLALGLRARVDELPAAARRLFREAATPSELWRRFPEEALLAISGRIDTNALFDVIGGFLTPEARKAMNADLNRQVGALLGGNDFSKDVLPGLGPDWGVCVTAPPPRAKGWMPQALFAFRLTRAKTAPQLDRTLLATIDFAARLAILGHNQQHADRPLTLKTTEVDKSEVHYLASERGLPTDVQPSYAIFHDCLVLASSLDAMTRFARSKPTPAPAADAEVPLVRISLKAWRTYLKERREPIAQFLAEQNGLKREAAGQLLDNLLVSLEFVDRLELRQRSGSGQVVFTLSARMAKAIRK
jgi:hypothetical protein